jgi:type IV secretion system protein VirB5
VTRTRSKSIDPIVIRDNWTGAYRFVVAGDRPAQRLRQDPRSSPTPAARRSSVEVVSVLQRSPATYQVQWRETTSTRGQLQHRQLTGLFTTKIDPPKNGGIRANPLGVFITAFQWSREP